MTTEPCPFDVEEAQMAATAWDFNCGPGALCALLGLKPEAIRPHLLDFEKKGYTNPKLMKDILNGMGVEWSEVFKYDGARAELSGDVVYPTRGLVRVQWGGPWTAPGRPVRARYRHTHWVAVRQGERVREVFDINATCEGWISWLEWSLQLVPWLLKVCEPRADGTWWPTHCWEVVSTCLPQANRRS